MVVKKREKFDMPPHGRYNESAMDIQTQAKNRFIIGLTGNIGTGKSTVMNVLRHLGAYGVDADELTKKAYQIGSISDQIKTRFGDVAVNSHGEVERKALAQIVFNDQQALADLEAILHPQVTRLTQVLVQTANLPVIVIEAIKLLESDLAALCDCIWVVDADAKTISGRLQKQRGMNESQIIERLTNQSPPADKKKKAHIIIENSGNRAETWDQVNRAWQKMMAESENFRKCDQETLALTAPFSARIVTPFSPAHVHAISACGPMENAVLIPGGSPLGPDSTEALICDSFVCAEDLKLDASSFSVWHLATFSLSMRGWIMQPGTEDKSDLPSTIALAEALARLQRVESINMAIPFPFNRDMQGYFMQNAFSRVSDDSPAAAEWHKAGYNVFNKQFWDVTLI